MILLLNTAESMCKITLVDGEWRLDDEWQADRALAKSLHKYLFDILQKNKKSWGDITAIGVFEGPGSFTGLRIGLTVANTVANILKVPIVGGREAGWQEDAIKKIKSGYDEKMVLPYYGAAANITVSKK